MKLPHRNLPIFVVVVSFAVIGTYLLFRSFAATPFVSLEPETGSLAGNVRSAEDSQASGGSFVSFGNSSMRVHGVRFPGSVDPGTRFSTDISDARLDQFVADGWGGWDIDVGNWYERACPDEGNRVGTCLSYEQLISELTASGAIARAKARGLDMRWIATPARAIGLGGSPVNDRMTAFDAPWFDDAAWSTTSNIWRQRAQDLYNLGGSGIDFNHEIGVPGTTSAVPEAQFHYWQSAMYSASELNLPMLAKMTKSRDRGEQIAAAMVQGMPGLKATWWGGNYGAPNLGPPSTYGIPRQVADFGVDTGNQDTSTPNFWAFMLGYLKGLSGTGNGKFVYDDIQSPYQFQYPSPSGPYKSDTYMANYLQYKVGQFHAALSQGMVTAYNQATFAKIVPNVGYSAELWVGGDNHLYPALDNQFITNFATNATKYGSGDWVNFFYGFDYSYARPTWTPPCPGYVDYLTGCFYQSGEKLAIRTVANQQLPVPGDPAPTLNVTGGQSAVNAGGNLSGSATASRGVRYVYWRNGANTTRLGAKMTLVDSSSNQPANVENLNFNSPSPLPLRFDWTLTDTPAGGQVCVEDIHGQTACTATASQ